MNEVKKPKKTMLVFYLVTLAIVMVINMVLVPFINSMQVKETDYGSFMSMTEAGNVGRVQIVASENGMCIRRCSTMKRSKEFRM